PAERLVAMAVEEGCDLIVTGTGKGGVLEKMLLGTTVNRLVRRTHLPVLMVKNRAHGPYGSILAATDFSDAAQRALLVAAGFFPDVKITVLHAWEPPFGGLGREGAAH